MSVSVCVSVSVFSCQCAAGVCMCVIEREREREREREKEREKESEIARVRQGPRGRVRVAECAAGVWTRGRMGMWGLRGTGWLCLCPHMYRGVVEAVQPLPNSPNQPALAAEAA
jgi:hypothetical protein